MLDLQISEMGALLSRTVGFCQYIGIRGKIYPYSAPDQTKPTTDLNNAESLTANGSETTSKRALPQT